MTEMLTGKQIEAACKNILFYTKQIDELTGKEFNNLVDNYNLSGNNGDDAVKAVESIAACLGAINYRVWAIGRNVQIINQDHLPKFSLKEKL